MNLKILSLVIIGVCILLPDVCYAFLSKDVHLLNMQNGLADNTVSAVYKDKEGFIWFGTRNGWAVMTVGGLQILKGVGVILVFQT